MPYLPFTGRPFLTQSPLIDCNLYVDLDVETKERTLYMRPGLTPWLNVGIQAQVRNLFGFQDKLIAVIGSNVYQIDPFGNATLLGQLLTSSGYVWIDTNSHEFMICDGQSGYLINVAETQIQTWTLYDNGSTTAPNTTIYQTTLTNTAIPTLVYDSVNDTVLLENTSIALLESGTSGEYYYDDVSTLYIVTVNGQAPQGIIVNQPLDGNLIQVTNPGMIGSGSLAVMDTYFIVTKGNQFQPSAADDGTNWDALNFATKEGYSDDIVTAFSDHRELWLFGQRDAEVWYDAGTSPFPFAQVPSGYLETGCGAAASPAKVDESIFWFTDKGQVVRAVQYSPQVVSSRRMEWNIAQYSRTDDAIGWRSLYRAREQYNLCFPTAGATWTYEPSTLQWHRRTSMGNTGNWRANCCTMFQNMWLVGDYENGIIYQLDENNYTDNGQPIKRIWTFPSVENKGQRIFHSRLEFVIEAGMGDTQGDVPQMALSWSDDGEKTFGNEVWRCPGNVGKYRNRILYDRLGNSRKRSYRIAQSDNYPTVIREVALNEGL